ncbi:hypothetical protein [Nocardia bhagyanarayanae]|uniref:Uncharacterized protein n=1 Tax=Nocardia bhagyanarayanae TaxID=1215925 RepID=A0A543FBU5_9NOCA|nr:hypothetical protein [Nocardia bhagyanarayanae]TQM31281.1 hypothetical protein FB390_2936 [Nocardia bhagyanarayanae]
MGLAIDDLPADTAAVLRRRARAAELPVAAYLRAELVARVGARAPEDAVVEFLESEGRDTAPEIDADASALVTVYDLPAETLTVLGRRARAAGYPLGDYARRELIASARRSTVEDAMLEFGQVADHGLDMAAVAAAVRYARGE